MRFFIGVCTLADVAKIGGDVLISAARLVRRRSGFKVGDWIMDSGAFSALLLQGGYPDPPEAYAALIARWAGNGNLLAAVSQDYMCEPDMVERTGLSIRYAGRRATVLDPATA